MNRQERRRKDKSGGGKILAALQKAHAMQQAGKLVNAKAAYQKILKVAPQDKNAHHLLGLALHQLGESEKGISHIKKAIAIDPTQASFYANLGNVFAALKQYDDALDVLQKAVTLAPADSDTKSNLGLVLRELGKLDEGEKVLRETLKASPGHGLALLNLGNILKDKEQTDEALSIFKEALKSQPANADLLANIGMLLWQKGGLDEAEQFCKKALSLNPQHLKAMNNLGCIFWRRGDLSKALDIFDQISAISPDYAWPHFNRGCIQLLKGNFKVGWQGYEWGLLLKDGRRVLNKAQLTKADVRKIDDVQDKSVLVLNEQGVGDHVMFSSILPDLAKVAKNVVAACDKRMVPLFKRSFQAVENLSFVTSGDHPGAVDDGICLGSLGSLFRNEMADFPKQNSFLKADEDKTKELRARYWQGQEGKKLIGIAWKSKNMSYGKGRSAGLDLWKPVLTTPDCVFVNLQYGDTDTDIERAQQSFGISIIDDKAIDPLASLDDFSAQVSAMDLIISIDNSTVHFAGGLGVPVWTLLPTDCDWRWLQEGEKSYWYPSMRLFRQKESGQWDEVFADVARALSSEF